MAYKEGDQPAPSYMLTKFLGRGGFGEVWMANAPGGTHVAVKIINIGAKQGRKELRAIRLVKQVHHPNLVPITALWVKDMEGNLLDDEALDRALTETTGGNSIRETQAFAEPAQRPTELIIAMGLGEKNLHDRLEECELEGLQGIPPEELLEYMEDSAKGIDYLNAPRHNLGGDSLEAIQHCDIKPHNIMIVGGAAQVCDFGLARTISDTRATSMAGSPAYGAPECLTGNKPSGTTDQYSLAISYYELRTGNLPFDDESFMGVINAHTQGRLNLSKLPDPERQVILRATAIDPEKRYETTTKMVRALRRAYEGGVTENLQQVPVTQSRPLPDVVELEPGMELVSGLTLVKRLVHSGIDEVWQAASGDGKRIALVIRDLVATKESADRGAISLLHRIEHPHLTKLYAYWLLDNHWAVVPAEVGSPSGSGPLASKLVISGRMAGKTLLQRLEELRAVGDDGIPFDELLVYISQIASAIDFLNSEQHALGSDKVGIQHRNVRPINLVLDGRVAKLGNHSLVKTLQGDDDILSSDVSVIAHSFVAPELIQGRLTRWSDQYSLAVSIVQLRTGTLPFDAAHSTTQLLKTLEVGELDLSALPPAEAEIIRRATARVPRERFASCLEMVKALKAANEQTAAGTRAGASPDQPQAPTASPDSTQPEPEESKQTAVGTSAEPGGVTDTQSLSEVGTKELYDPPAHDVLDEDDIEPEVNIAETLDSGLLDLAVGQMDELKPPADPGSAESPKSPAANPPEPETARKEPAQPASKRKTSKRQKSKDKRAQQQRNEPQAPASEPAKPKQPAAKPSEKPPVPAAPPSVAAESKPEQPDESRSFRGTMTSPLMDEVNQEQRKQFETPLAGDTPAPGDAPPSTVAQELRGTLDSPLLDEERERKRESLETPLEPSESASLRGTMAPDQPMPTDQLVKSHGDPGPETARPVAPPVDAMGSTAPEGISTALIGWAAGGVALFAVLIMTVLFTVGGDDPTPVVINDKDKKDKTEDTKAPVKDPKDKDKQEDDTKSTKKDDVPKAELLPDDILYLALRDVREDKAGKWKRILARLDGLVGLYTPEEPETEENRALRVALTVLARRQTTPEPELNMLTLAEGLAMLQNKQTDLMPHLAESNLTELVNELADEVIESVLMQADRQLAADPGESAATYRRLYDLLDPFMQPGQLGRVYLGRARALARKPAWQGVGLELASLSELQGLALTPEQKSIQTALGLLVRQNTAGTEKLDANEILAAVAGLNLEHLDADTERVAIEQLKQSALGDFADAALADVKKAKDAKALADALARLETTYKLNPQSKLVGLQATADTQYRLQLYGDFRKTLAELRPLVKDPKELAQLETQRLLSVSLDPKATAAERKQVRTELLTAVKAPQSSRRVELCRALYTAAQDDEALQLQAQAALEAAVKLIPEENNQQAVQRMIAGLRSGADKKVKLLALAPADNAKAFFESLNDLSKTSGGEWGTVAKAEVSVETATDLTSELIERHRAQVSSAAKSPDAELKSYARYVQALLANAEKQPQVAAATIADVMANSPGDAKLLTEVRATRCAQILATAAVQRASYPASDDLIRLTLGKPLSADAADQAYTWLQLALKTRPDAVKNHEQALALASWYKTRPDQETARRLAPALIEGQVADINLPLLWIHAQTRTDAEQETGLGSYAEIWRRLEPLAEKQGLKALEQLDQTVLSPALELAKAQPLQTSPAAAALYAARGHMIWKHGFGSKDKAVRDLDGIDAYNRAIGLAGDQATGEMYAGRAHFRIELKHKLDELRPDIEKAVALDPQYKPLLGMLGVRMVKHAQSLSGKSQQAVFADAIRHLTTVLESTDPKPADETRGQMLAQRSTAYLESSTAHQADADKFKELLHKARDDAQAASKLNDSAQTYLSLGQSLVRLADAGDDAFNNFDAAATAFTQALAKDPGNEIALYGRGRARFQRWAAGDKRQDLLDQAATDLGDVVSRSTELPAPHYWLARVLTAQEKRAEADTAYAKAADLAEQAGDTAAARTYQQEWLENLKLELLAQPDRRAEIRKHLMQIGSSAEQATLLARTYVLDQDLAKSFEVADAALKSVKEFEPQHVELLINRGSARVQLGNANTLKDRLTRAVADADAAAGAADEKTQAGLKAEALYLASYCRVHLGTIKAAGRAVEPQAKIVDDLTKAIEITSDNPPAFSWQWRFMLASELKLFAESSRFALDKRTKWKQDALDYLDQAIKEPSLKTEEKATLEGLRTKVEAIKFN